MIDLSFPNISPRSIWEVEIFIMRNFIFYLFEIMDDNIQESDTLTEEISDGYHTFKELYQYRRVYNAMLVNEFAKQKLHNVHKSYKHSE